MVHLLGIRTRLELRFLWLNPVLYSAPWFNHQRILRLNKLNNPLCPLLLKISTKKKYKIRELFTSGFILLWEHLDLRASGTLPVTNGGPEVAFPSSATLYGVEGLLALLCDPAAKQLLLGLLLFHSHSAAFLTIPMGFKLLQHECQPWALWAKASSVGTNQHSHFPGCC